MAGGLVMRELLREEGPFLLLVQVGSRGLMGCCLSCVGFKRMRAKSEGVGQWAGWVQFWVDLERAG